MILKDLVRVLDAEVYTKDIYEENLPTNYAFSCDLMSDALMLLRNAPFYFCDEGVLVTGLATVQGIRTAEMLDLNVIVLVRGKIPTNSTIEEAKRLGIIIIGTKLAMFSTSAKMFLSGVKGLSDL
ncbi:MAG: transcriptional regulator [Bacilli bacterium]|jgi:hypothetical protein